MSALAADADSAAPPDQARFRYGVVLLLVLALLVFAVLAPDADWARAVSVLLAGGALTIAVGTSRASGSVRRARAIVVGGAVGLVVVGIATGVVSAVVTFLVVTALAAGVPFALAGGVVRLIRREGVTPQAVAGALAIYLLVGVLFASVVSVAAHFTRGPFFSQSHVTNGDRVYYSLTILTTTGFGDYTPVTPVGHALAVLEMLTGQLYLVTVIGILVGSLASRRASG